MLLYCIIHAFLEWGIEISFWKGGGGFTYLTKNIICFLWLTCVQPFEKYTALLPKIISTHMKIKPKRPPKIIPTL